jgi:hypothetical protein
VIALEASESTLPVSVGSMAKVVCVERVKQQSMLYLLTTRSMSLMAMWRSRNQLQSEVEQQLCRRTDVIPSWFMVP